MRGDWDMRFAIGGKEALKMLGDCPASLVVSDMKMQKPIIPWRRLPGQNG